MCERSGGVRREGPTVAPQPNTKPVDVPPAVRAAAAKALANLPAETAAQAPAAPQQKVRVDVGPSKKVRVATDDEAALQAQAEMEAQEDVAGPAKKQMKLPE